MSSIVKELQWPKVVQLSRGSLNEVSRVQEWLVLHGQILRIDGVFGPKTRQCLANFLGVDPGEADYVDSERFRRLCRPLARAVQNTQAVPESYPAAVLEVAKKHLAQSPREVGGANRGPWVRHYMQGRQGARFAWCAGFVSTILAQAAEWLYIKAPEHISSCDWMAKRAKDRQDFLGSFPPVQDSCCIFLVRHSDNDWVHAGIAFDFEPTSFPTIEGNTDPRGGSNGVAVFERRRGFERIDFIRISVPT